jgi:hypothetical protein
VKNRFDNSLRDPGAFGSLTGRASLLLLATLTTYCFYKKSMGKDTVESSIVRSF